MNVLIIGSGGREHCLAWKIKQSPLLKTLHAIPGSPAMSQIAECPGISQSDFKAIAGYCLEKDIHIVLVGPEEPLAKGIGDFLSGKGIKVFGPSQRGAAMEASKQFAKEFMQRNLIPTADFETLHDSEFAKEKIKNNKKYPVVIKADGLAAGKGVRICKSEAEALEAVSDFMDKRIFGFSGSKIVMEEFLTGKEVSVMAFVDGNSFLLLPVSRDHKRLLDKDGGPNTGGMGAICPVELESKTVKTIEKEILSGFIEGIQREAISYCGIIYAGMMLTAGGPKVLEFNVRFGDPETQAVLPLLKSDLLEIIKSCVEGRLNRQKIETQKLFSTVVVLTSRGYPDNPEKGKEISGLEYVQNSKNIFLFHAGTKRENAKWLTSGGRIINVAGLGSTAEEARKRAYSAISDISFDGMHYRKDIGGNI
ncbi:MAG: phosphoribosylamine--glycine ligase [Elusimicrobia bacterium]|nr:phosphoribosylamine--glycine ligase [Elusimicrobiota bacterium]